ncbi:MAG TPA: hypothetical protein VFM02_00120 [Candidatus Paceibacterota bacterium]|nr:hypothetical protein [Candidatus Paceibacterota bacterium]
MAEYFSKKFFKGVFAFLALVVGLLGFFLPILPFLVLFGIAMELLGYPIFSDRWKRWYADYEKRHHERD